MTNNNENEKSSASQCAMIKRYLLSGKSITAIDALNMFGCMRLASRICDLREQGLNIGKRRLHLWNGKTVCEYFLNK